MGFPIPDPYVWDPSFRTFYSIIDDEHKTLFNGIFHLAIDDNADNLGELRRCTGKHFLNEQVLMQASQYQFYDEHKKEHETFIHALDNWKGDVKWAKSWLVNHIKTIDFKYKGKI
uniref:Hemerythrin n=1 Tax=Phascolopsis gouldii TaxID=6442 RepID=HEMT_PHAGO|nr:RecName: Full=Hemerythrin [Phascolopsis gouldii]1I4Y_A Chain A, METHEMERYTHRIN [Phascolopsis gouldii]1I4Y_B Chain B, METHEMERYTHRIN [Phascolopsis gouldii]1I4Y_C Chain C, METHEMERYTHRIN [Phascolopsis gouldii]1I4Y_D Chain D, METHEMERYTHRIN [Phascolopsis gouldii]1I4Y_E Chain E, METHEMERYTHRIN [Phascolopsis gouldii]1I4Y_F Chain F, METHEMERYTHRIN [Phascolopsis gouldii]1I4Y_G Chain G, METHEMERYTHRIN [Phascolopsis gouldii]1I4Y_H Chain H, METHEMERYTHRIN [Phascolopsis gouldii]AAF25482.1 hemeryth